MAVIYKIIFEGTGSWDQFLFGGLSFKSYTFQCCRSGSGIRYLFDPWIRDPGTGISLWIPDLGSQIPNQYFWELSDNSLGKIFYNSLKISPNFFLQHLKNTIIFNFGKFMASKRVITTNFFTPFFCCCLWIWDPRSEIRYPGSGIRYPGSGIRYLGSGIRDPVSGIRDPVSGIRYPGPRSGIRDGYKTSRIRHTDTFYTCPYSFIFPCGFVKENSKYSFLLAYMQTLAR